MAGQVSIEVTKDEETTSAFDKCYEQLVELGHSIDRKNAIVDELVAASEAARKLIPFGIVYHQLTDAIENAKRGVGT